MDYGKFGLSIENKLNSKEEEKSTGSWTRHKIHNDVIPIRSNNNSFIQICISHIDLIKME